MRRQPKSTLRCELRRLPCCHAEKLATGDAIQATGRRRRPHPRFRKSVRRKTAQSRPSRRCNKTWRIEPRCLVVHLGVPLCDRQQPRATRLQMALEHTVSANHAAQSLMRIQMRMRVLLMWGEARGLLLTLWPLVLIRRGPHHPLASQFHQQDQPPLFSQRCPVEGLPPHRQSPLDPNPPSSRLSVDVLRRSSGPVVCAHLRLTKKTINVL